MIMYYSDTFSFVLQKLVDFFNSSVVCANNETVVIHVEDQVLALETKDGES